MATMLYKNLKIKNKKVTEKFMDQLLLQFVPFTDREQCTVQYLCT